MEKKSNSANPNWPSELVVGLDLGTTKIAAIVGRKNEFGKVEILGVGKFEAWKAGKFELSQLSREVENDVYGLMRSVTPLKDLINDN